MATDAQKRAVLKYDSANTTQIHLKLNNKTDADVLAWLTQQENVQGYIKQLIREDMNKNPLPYLVVEVIDKDERSEGHRFEKYCPSCNAWFGHFYPPKYCQNCGQFIDVEQGKKIKTEIIDKRTKKD